MKQYLARHSNLALSSLLASALLIAFSVAQADESCVKSERLGSVILRGNTPTKFTGIVECTPQGVTIRNAPGVILGTSLSMISAQSDASGVCLALGFAGSGAKTITSLRFANPFPGTWSVVTFNSQGKLTSARTIESNQDTSVIDSLVCNH